MTNASLDFEDTIQVVCEFLEVSFLCILYARKLYPPELFEQRSKYGVPVYASRHPELTGYVRDLVLAVVPNLRRGIVERVGLDIINGASYKTYERFIFHFSFLLPPTDQPAEEYRLEEGPTAADLEVRFRGCIASILQVGEGGAEPVGEEDRTFALIMRLKEDAAPSTDGPVEFPWVPEDDGGEGGQIEGVKDRGKGKQRADPMMKGASSVLDPMQTVNTGWIKFELSREVMGP